MKASNRAGNGKPGAGASPHRVASRFRHHRLPVVTMALEQLPGGAMLVDAEDRIAAVNARAARMFGYKRGSLRGRPVNELIPGWAALRSKLHTHSLRSSQRVDSRARRADGSDFPVRVMHSSVESAGRELVLVCISDSTQRRIRQARLRDAQYGFEQIARAMPHMLWTCQPDGAVTYVSPQWTAFTGTTFESQLGEGWIEQVHPKQRNAIHILWQRCIERTETFRAEFRVCSREGRYRWFDSTCIPVRDRDGTVVRWLGSNVDIHDAHETRQALIAERDRFSKLVATAPGVISAFRVRPDGSRSFPFASARICDLYGFTAEELARDAAPGLARIHPDDAPRVAESVEKSARTLTPWYDEWRVLHPQKGEIWVEGRSVPMREPDGGTLFYGIMMDVTKRKRAEEELRRSRARLEAAVKAGGIGTWIWNLRDDAASWDDAMYALWGRRREAAVLHGRDVAAFVHENDRERMRAEMAAVIDSDADDLALEFRIRRENGAVQWMAMTGRVERDVSGRAWCLIGACMDVTARRKAEESQRHSQKVEALGTLAGGVAHDFNNILLAITGNARLAMQDLPHDHPVHRNLAEIDKASARAANLVHRILAFSRQAEPGREIVSLRPAIEEALKLLRATLPAMIVIRSSFAADAPPVRADSTQIHQVVMNLVTNSAHAIGDDPGVITVALDNAIVAQGDALAQQLKPGRYLCLRVSDTGCGMDRATLDRIFDPFFTTKPAGQGTGLGLPVVHGIVRGHEGTITVESDAASGTTFRLYFPAAISTARDQRDLAREAPKGRGQHIMYVDDEDSLVFLITRMLERQGYEVSGFTDPGQALLAFQQEPRKFDVVVTDVSMPGMSGFHLARMMLDERGDLPVIMTSGYVRPQDRQAARELGVRDLILKPNTVEALGHALARVFEAEKKQ